MKFPYIVAEVGSNFRNIADCKLSIQLAKSCGADAVKFQLYTHRALYGFDGEMQGALPQGWIGELAEKAQGAGIDFMCTAFSPELFDVVDPYVKIHKIASSEACHIQLLRRAKQSGKPVVISFGGHSDNDIRRTLSFMEDTTVYPLYCVPEYPANHSDAFEYARLRKHFYQWKWGYSDHTKDPVNTPRFFATYPEFSVLEKHVNFVGCQSPDSPHSLSTDEFKAMVKAVRGEAYALPSSEQGLAMQLKHKRRVVATRDIVAGEILDPSKCGIFRSRVEDARGAHPFQYEGMLGKRTRHLITKGQGIASHDVESV